MIRLTITADGLGQTADLLRRIADRIPDQLEDLTRETADETLAALQRAAPTGRQVPGGRTPGQLVKSIQFDLDGTTAEFTASDVAGFVIGGTDAHTIQGHAGPLHFYWEKAGGEVTFMRVHHPGTQPNDFRVPALDEAAAEAEQLLDTVADTLTEGFAG